MRNANRWINQLPGAWTGRWRHLKLSGDLFGQIYRTEFVGHVRAALAYLESNREFIRVTRIWSWPFKRAKQYPPDPIDAEFDEFDDVTPSDQKRLPKPRKSVRVVK